MSRSKHVSLRGGLMSSDSPIEVFPGAMKDGVNFYESIEGGDTRVGGYERFDGQNSPAEQSYYVARFDSWDTHVTDINDDTTITVDSTITMRVLHTDAVTESDTLIAVVTYIDETEIPADLDTTPLNWDGTSSLVSIIKRGEDDEATDLTYLEDAWDYARDQIGAVSGDGDLLGCFQINDTVVVPRTDSGTPKIYYSSTSGWTEGKIGRVVEITGYGDDVLPGETIDSANFEVLGVCEWYDQTTGVADGTKAWFVIAPIAASTAPATGANSASGGGTFTIASVLNPITTWGTYIEYVNHNFLSDPDDLATWWVDGTNLPMCWSDRLKVVVPIADDWGNISTLIGTTICRLEDELMWSTGEGTFVISEPGLPFNYGGAYGAAEVGVGDVITALQDADGEQMIAFTGRRAMKLIGSDTSDFVFKSASGVTGAYRGSVSLLDDLYSLSARGVCQLRRAEAQGGYFGGSISEDISEHLILKAGLFANTSHVIPSKEHVRWYFSDNTFLMMTRLPTPDGIRFAFSFGEYTDRPVNNICTETWSDGSERTFFTSDTGYVYEAEKGTNFDGAAIYCWLDLQDNHLGSPGHNKLFERIFWDIKSTNYVSLTLTFRLNYGEKQFDSEAVVSNGGRSVFDEGLFDVATFDSSDRTRARAKLKGKGHTIGLSLENESKFVEPFNVTSYTIHYQTLGRAKR